MSARVDEVLARLSECPQDDPEHAQIDASQCERLKALIGKPSAEQAAGMKSILDDCCFGSLASDFAMLAMDAVWTAARVDAGGIV